MYLALFNNLFYDEEFLKRLHLIGLQSEKGDLYDESKPRIKKN